MSGERYEIRLDPEMRRVIKEIADERYQPVSEVVRQAIKEFCDDALREKRLRIVAELGEMQIEEMPDPETLSRQLDEAHDPEIP